ncbi:alpha/beta fold hydrolase [Actinomycetospora sp. OC33-EN08]|uniref:Alpha/beta fold hydrolase n=1 Tax=Actinomycetospora aurantiaca TaxID=3129233 RepID=A0ABU8MW11_9PSEU
MLAHSRSGSGEPLFLVHGITHRRQGWDPVVPLLEAEHEVIAVDLPGHGESPEVDRAFDGSISYLVDAVEGLARDLGLERPHVAGNSLGGLIALEMAARGSVRSATALSPGGFWSPVGRLWAKTLLGGASKVLQTWPRERLDRVLSSPAGRYALLGALVAHPGRAEYASMGDDLQGLARPREGFATMLATLEKWTVPRRSDVPTMVGWGSRDLLLPRAQIRRLRRVLPDARVVVLPGCGHVPMADDPGLTAELILGNARVVPA